MRTQVLAALFVLSVAGGAGAQEVLPATSDDIQSFDRLLETQKELGNSGTPEPDATGKRPSGDGTAGRRSDFGAEISSEARHLRNSSGKSSTKNFGHWVKSNKVKRDSEGHGTNSGHEGSTERSKEDSDNSGPH
jgi:hypothetical protein